MNRATIISAILTILIPFNIFAQEPTTIHIFVALCDNENQGIVPVPETIGNGQNPASNLYWGAGYGVKTYFKNSEQWNLVATTQPAHPDILESLLFKHADSNIWLLADAYDGAGIKTCITDFLEASAGNNRQAIMNDSVQLDFGGNAGLLAYVGHNGLMEFPVFPDLNSGSHHQRDVMIIACYSKHYFKRYIRDAGARPVLWTNGLLSAEAYTLHDAISGWIKREGGEQIRSRAAKAYHRYQKCGIKGATNLFSPGF